MTLTELATLVDRIGVISTVVLVLLIILWLLVRGSLRGQEHIEKMSESNQSELIELRKELKEATDAKFELEKKFTKCIEDREHERGEYRVLDEKTQHAVERFLDDTQDLDREILLLHLAIKDKDALIASLQAQIEGYKTGGTPES